MFSSTSYDSKLSLHMANIIPHAETLHISVTKRDILICESCHILEIVARKLLLILCLSLGTSSRESPESRSHVHEAQASTTLVKPARARTLFILTPRMPLARPGADWAVGRRLLHERVDRYERRDWPAMLVSLRGSPLPTQMVRKRMRATCSANGGSPRAASCAKARSAAGHLLTGSALAPGDAGTWAALKRPDRPRVPIPPELPTQKPRRRCEKPGVALRPAPVWCGWSTSSCS